MGVWGGGGMGERRGRVLLDLNRQGTTDGKVHNHHQGSLLYMGTRLMSLELNGFHVVNITKVFGAYGYRVVPERMISTLGNPEQKLNTTGVNGISMWLPQSQEVKVKVKVKSSFIRPYT